MAVTIDTRNARRPGRVPAAATARVSLRARAFAAAQRHSLLVRLLRFLFPVAACGILGAYALVVARNWLDGYSKFKVGSIEITADDLTMKDPSYFDITSDGRYEVRAKRAVVAFGQNKNAPIKLIDVSGDLTQTTGTVTRLKAKHGLFYNAKGELELFDGIEIDGSNGVMARLSRAMIYSKEGRVVSVDPVSATMPTGSIQAAAMTMSTKTRLAQFRGDVNVRLVAQGGQGFGTGRDARQPVDLRSAELDVDDAAKTAHFREKVVAIQGETMLQTPYLMVKYEGKAAAGLGSPAPAAPAPETGKEAGKDSARVTFLWARNGVEITSGNDRRITSELADFDVAADTALFAGSVVAIQDKNVLKGGRLHIDRKGGKSRLETPGEGGRIAATFHPNAAGQAPAKRPTVAEAVQESMLGSFKADRTAPMNVEANRLDLHDTGNKAIFSGNVAARQGDLLLRTSELVAFYSGQSGMGLTAPGDGAAPKLKGQEKGEITRLEAAHSVILTSKDQSATAKWATFDVKANTALLGGGVTVTKRTEDPGKIDTTTGDRLKVNLTTGIFNFESDPGAAPAVRKPPPPVARGPATGAPAVSAVTPEEKVKACPPGRICGLLFPNQAKEKALDILKKKAPAVDVQ
jgi:lipopolysaccharide transport protein LptA